VKRFGWLDIMVINAGIETRTSVLDTTEFLIRQGDERQSQERVLRHATAATQMIKAAEVALSTSSVHETGRCRAIPPIASPKAMRMLTRTAGLEPRPS
jgi:glucose 1-dehydrogenase